MPTRCEAVAKVQAARFMTNGAVKNISGIAAALFLLSFILFGSKWIEMIPLAERHTQLGKKLHLRHLSPDCLELLDKAKGMIEVNVLEDPLYHPADNRPG